MPSAAELPPFTYRFHVPGLTASMVPVLFMVPLIDPNDSLVRLITPWLLMTPADKKSVLMVPPISLSMVGAIPMPAAALALNVPQFWMVIPFSSVIACQPGGKDQVP